MVYIDYIQDASRITGVTRVIAGVDTILWLLNWGQGHTRHCFSSARFWIRIYNENLHHLSHLWRSKCLCLLSTIPHLDNEMQYERIPWCCVSRLVDIPGYWLFLFTVNYSMLISKHVQYISRHIFTPRLERMGTSYYIWHGIYRNAESLLNLIANTDSVAQVWFSSMRIAWWRFQNWVGPTSGLGNTRCITDTIAHCIMQL